MCKSSKAEQQVLLKIIGLDLGMYSKMKEDLLDAGQQYAHLLPATGPGLYQATVPDYDSNLRGGFR